VLSGELSRRATDSPRTTLRARDTVLAMPPAGLTSAELRAAFVADISRVWQVVHEQRPNHVPYALIIDGRDGEGIYLVPHVLTAEGLAQVARRYVDTGHHDEFAEAADALRYSIADSPLWELCFNIHADGVVRFADPG
jgi:hypothetical protein